MNTGQLVVAVVIRIKADSSKPIMAIRVPNGLNLPAGINLQIDGSKPELVSLKTCDLQGCYGETELDNKFLETLKHGKQLAIAFKSSTNNNVSLQMPLANFVDAFQKIQ